MKELYIPFMVIGAMLASAISGVAMGKLFGTKSAYVEIARKCAADGRFVLSRDGISWTYSCSKPKVDLTDPTVP